MPIIRQLFREFWLPLILGLAWTIFNLASEPVADWDLRTFVNTFGPTFFFVSWLIAQWYRVKKQQRVEEGLIDIQADLRAMQSPLLPCGLFITLTAPCTEETARQLFEKQQGYRQYGKNWRGEYGPRTGQARLHTPFGYLDFREGAPTAVGVLRRGHPGYNPIYRDLNHTFCQLGYQDATDKRGDLLVPPAGAEVEFFFARRRPSAHTEPSLCVKTTVESEIRPVYAALIDDALFVDFAIKGMVPTRGAETGWSTADLKGARVRVALSFLFIRGIIDLPQPGKLRLHNLQLWLGQDADRVLSFSPEQLALQESGPAKELPVGGMADSMQLVLDVTIHEHAFSAILLRSR